MKIRTKAFLVATRNRTHRAKRGKGSYTRKIKTTKNQD